MGTISIKQLINVLEKTDPSIEINTIIDPDNQDSLTLDVTKIPISIKRTTKKLAPKFNVGDQVKLTIMVPDLKKDDIGTIVEWSIDFNENGEYYAVNFGYCTEIVWERYLEQHNEKHPS